MQKIDFSYFEKRDKYKKLFPKKSYGEIDVKIFLEEHNIEFKEEVPAVITEKGTGKQLNIRVDFLIEKYNIIIEYNGRQHYEIVPDFGGEIEFIRQQERDNLLRNACKDNGYILIEIPYYDIYDKYFKQILELYNKIL